VGKARRFLSEKEGGGKRAKMEKKEYLSLRTRMMEEKKGDHFLKDLPKRTKWGQSQLL